VEKYLGVGTFSLSILMQYQYCFKRKYVPPISLLTLFCLRKIARLKSFHHHLFSVICKRPFCNDDDVVTPKILVKLDPITKKQNLETQYTRLNVNNSVKEYHLVNEGLSSFRFKDVIVSPCE